MDTETGTSPHMAHTAGTAESRRQLFLEFLAQHGNAVKAGAQAGTQMNHLYNRRAKDPKFAKLWANALNSAGESLKDEARRRAVDGVQEPVFFQGEVCGHITKFSDALLALLIKNLPENRQSSVVVQQSDGSAVAMTEGPQSTIEDQARKVAFALALARNSLKKPPTEQETP